MAPVLDRTDLTGISVLVVDDDEEARETFKDMLEAHGASVLTAASAGEGVELFRAHRPNVLVGDIRMPDRDGYWLIRELQDAIGFVAALAVTGYVHEDIHLHARRAGYREVLAKPVGMDLLCAAVGRLAGRMSTGAGDAAAEREAAILVGERHATTSEAQCPYCGSLWIHAVRPEPRGMLAVCRECSLPFYWR